MMNHLPIALGADSFGTTVSQETAFEIMDAFASLGGRILDTANNYAYYVPEGEGGESEQAIGRWLARSDRTDMMVMTKVGSMVLDAHAAVSDRVFEGLAPEVIHRATEACLARLGIDCIDILLAHHDHSDAALLETWTAFSELVSCGKAKTVGVSNYSAARLKELVGLIDKHSLAPLGAVQVKYTVIDRVCPSEPALYAVFDTDTKAMLHEVSPDTMVFAYSPLVSGQVFEKSADAEWPQEYDSAGNREKVEAIQREARALKVSPSAVVLKQLVDDGIIPVTGTTKPKRLADNLRLVVPAWDPKACRR